MAHPGEISILQQMALKPTAWRWLEHADGQITLAFTYAEPSAGGWQDVMTRRGGVKWYKTATAAMRDIARVQASPVIQAHLRAIYGQGGDDENT